MGVGLKFWKRKSTGPEAEEIKALSDQFRVTLLAAVRKIEETSPDSSALEPIRRLLEKGRPPSDRDEAWHWKDAYEVEQQIVLFYDKETLETELARRVLEAQHVLYPDVAGWYEKQLEEVDTIEDKRALLMRLVNDLQWRYTVNEAKLGYVKDITRRTGGIFIVAVIVFVAFLLMLFLGNSYYGTTVPTQIGADAGVVDWVWWHTGRFRAFLLAAVSGYFGAAFSMVSSLKARLESSGLNQMKSASSLPILLSRVLVGTGAAMVLYFLFESNLVSGAAFPNFEKLFATDAASGAEGTMLHRALLIVWCFIAGFSEKFVPGLLAKTEAQASEESQGAPHSVPAAAPPAHSAPRKPEPGAAGDGEEAPGDDDGSTPSGDPAAAESPPDNAAEEAPETGAPPPAAAEDESERDPAKKPDGGS